jgi:hypothetical protein
VDKKYLVYAALILAGVILAGRIRSLPGGSKLPSV